MIRKNLIILSILCASLMLRADSCVVEQRDVALVFPAEVEVVWESIGWTQANFSETKTVSVAEAVREGLERDELPDGPLNTIHVSGVVYRVLSNSGHVARRTGYVNIDGIRLLNFDVPSNASGVAGSTQDGKLPPAGGGTVELVRAGVDLVNARLNTWLGQYNADPASANDGLLSFAYTADWSSNPAPNAGDPDNFTWETNLIVQINMTAEELDVFNP